MKRLVRRIVPAVIVVLLAAGLFSWWQATRGSDLPDGIVRGNGRIEMTRTDVAVKYPGRLVALRVQEGDLVHAGDVIAEEDAADTLAQLRGARAARDRAAAAVDRAEGERAVRAGQARLAGIDLRETAKLRDQAMVSPVELEQRRVAYDTASAGVTAAGGGVSEARTAIAQADAQIAQIDTVLADLKIRAPGPGRVEYRIVEPGTVLPAGGKIVSLVNPEDVYLTIFLPAETVARLRIGDEARVLPEGFDTAIPARIGFIAPDAQFTPKFVETKSEREKLSYRVKLRIPADVARGLDGRLKAGMTADGFVRTDPRQAWPSFKPRKP